MLKFFFATLLCIGALAAIAVNPAEAADGIKPKITIDRNQPLQVDADRLDAYNDKRTVVFTGNVVAVQGARTIRSEQMTIYYKSGGKASGTASPSLESSGNIERIEARGKVSIVEDKRVASGDMAVFDQEDQKITLSGNAVLQEGQNTISGSRVVIFLKENRGVVESQEGRRVSATIYPDQKR